MRHGEWLGWAVLGLVVVGCVRDRPPRANARPAPTVAEATPPAEPSATPVVPSAAPDPLASSPPSPQVFKGSVSGPCPGPRLDSVATKTASCPEPRATVRGDGIEIGEDLPPVKPSAMPPWDVDDNRDFACAYACADGSATGHLLAWSIAQDHRPLRNHYSLYAEEQPGKPLTLVTMYRHATNSWWNIQVSFHHQYRSVEEFAAPPAQTELDRMFEANRWRFTHEPDWDGFKILAGNVLDDVWTKVLGSKPRHHYPKGIER